MSIYHFFDINDYEGYSIVYVGDKKYEFRIQNEKLLFFVISNLLSILLITEKAFPVITKSNVKMMNFFTESIHKYVQLYNNNNIDEKTLRKLISINVGSSVKYKTQIPAKLLLSIESDYKDLSQNERIRIVSDTIMKMKKIKILLKTYGIRFSIAENARLSGLESYLENEKTKLELEIEPANQILTGFDCKRSKNEIKKIFIRMTKAGYLKADWTDFLAVFRNKVIVEHKPIVWCIKATRGKNVGRGNKAALREFLKLLLQKDSLSAQGKRKVPIFFVDEDNNAMTIQNPSKDESSLIDFKPIFTGLF